MYILFDLEKNECYKADDLQNLRSFTTRNFDFIIDWNKIAAANVVFSDCGKFSIERSKADIKGIHLIATIADGTEKSHQN
jgi:hypothetical protein